ncbi:protein of unknown function [Aminobacter niigataensis]|nr:protein of unknown function [Aminobacter niigataensis]
MIHQPQHAFTSVEIVDYRNGSFNIPLALRCLIKRMRAQGGDLFVATSPLRVHKRFWKVFRPRNSRHQTNS